jgi:serine/threonine protein kinase
LSASDSFARLDRALADALELQGSDRAEFLRDLELRDPELARELAELLQKAELSEQFLTFSAAGVRDQLLSRALDIQAQEGSEPQSRIGQKVGHFYVEHELAHGLRSEVYLARRDDPEWQQQVVVKILTRGISSDDVLRRFLAERQILSVLHHPHIATLLDGGVTDDGLPYFVMEYIEGKPVTAYCNERQSGLSERLELCRQICQAVAFAHRHLVVHRDLKPSNILVTREGAVKLLDFGIAKLLDPIADGADISERTSAVDPGITPRTEEHVRLMTPRYASPEQRTGEAITTATDVYQLGLVFSEILGGPVPGKLTRGDLDWILLKALEQRPEDRYGSAGGLLDDLEKYRAHLPVSARRATIPYLLGRFASRRPVVTVTLGLALLGLVVFVLMLALFTRQLESERSAAVAAAERAEEVKRLLVSFIAAPDPFSGSGADTRVSEVLQASEQEITRSLADRPQLQMELISLLADVYQNLALHQESIVTRNQELALRGSLGEVGSLEALQARRKLAQSRQALGEVEAALEEFQDLRESLAANHPATHDERALVDTAIGAIHAYYGRAETALPFLDEALVELQAQGSDPVLLADALHHRAMALGALTRHDEAYDLLLDAYELRMRHQGEQHVSTLMELTQVAASLTNRGMYSESIEIYQEVLPGLEQRLGSLHPQVLTVLNNSAVSHDLAGQLEQSAELHRQSLARRREKFGDQHGDVAESLQNLGSVLTRLEKYDEALPPLQEAARLFPGIYQPGSPRLAYPHISLAIVYSQTGDVGLLESHARTALELLEGQAPESHPALLRSRCLLGDALIRRGNPGAGIPLLENSIAGLESQTSISPVHLQACRAALARTGTASNPEP